ncbi:O-antigen ligase family protein [candidate division KSB1 bacterium]|nr:O-antigen ligase family protein [candidate division KSB1 bacterium]
MTIRDDLHKKLLQVIVYALYIVAVAMPFSIALTQMALAVACMAWILRIFITKDVGFRAPGLEWAVAAFVIAEILATLFSIDRGQSLIHLKRLLLIPLIYLIAANVTDEKTLKRLAWLFFFSIVVYSLWGLGWYFLHPGRRVQHLHHFMTAGGITMIGAVMGATFALRADNGRERLIFTAATVAVVLCLILTSTRGSWVGFFCALVFVLYYTRRALIIAVPVLMVIFYLLTPQAFSHRLQHFFDPDWRTNAKRLYWWQVGWEIIKERPLIGIGDINTTDIYNRYADADKQGRLNHFHSNYVHIAVTLGLIGLLAFLGLIGSVFRQLYRVFFDRRNASGWSTTWALAALAIFWALNINGFFEWNCGDAEIITMIWFCTGVSLALSQQALRR